MRIYFNLEIDKYINTKGENAIMIRCTFNRQHKRINTGTHINSKFWDATTRRVKKSHPLSKELNAVIGKQLLEIEKLYLEMLRNNDEITLSLLLQKLNKPISSNFYDFAYAYKLNLLK